MKDLLDGAFLCLFLSIFFITSCVENVGPSVGTKGILTSSAPWSPVAISEEAFSEWRKAKAAKDDHGQTLLIASKKILAVKKGTPSNKGSPHGSYAVCCAYGFRAYWYFCPLFSLLIKECLYVKYESLMEISQVSRAGYMESI